MSSLFWGDYDYTDLDRAAEIYYESYYNAYVTGNLNAWYNSYYNTFGNEGYYNRNWQINHPSYGSIYIEFHL